MRFTVLGRKLGWLAGTLAAVVTFNFLLFRVLPGDPVRLYQRSGHLTPEAAAQLRTLFGLDKPLIEQFWIYVRGLAHGDLGFSFAYHRPVADIVAERLVNTLVLVGVATVLVVVIGVIMGVVSASRRGSKVDSATVFGSLVLWSMPTFWVGMLLIFALGVWAKIFPITGITTAGATYSSPLGTTFDVARHLVLPTLTLALVDIGQFVLITRSSLVDVLTEDFVTTAKAKGMTRSRVVWRHGMRNAMLPVVTTSALYIGLVVGGAIQVETVFSWPGMGELTYEAVRLRDYAVLEACFLLFAVTVILANFLSDLLYVWLDPRVREA
ncbi:MAG: peptide/nickel transport system permease protein [Actinomycetota bacterium]|nr:peptide/nickel transport system permease protein [Actinomycetota bacterium]